MLALVLALSYPHRRTELVGSRWLIFCSHEEPEGIGHRHPVESLVNSIIFVVCFPKSHTCSVALLRETD